MLAESARPPVYASDIDERVLSVARDNATRAGVTISFARADVRALQREHERAWSLPTHRMANALAQLDDFDRELSQVFARLHLRLSRVVVLAHDPGLSKQMRGKPVLEHTLWNGPARVPPVPRANIV